MESQNCVWEELKTRQYIPGQAKSFAHEPRDGLAMCSNHHIQFDNYEFFLRFDPKSQKHIFINYSDNPDEQSHHGKAVALDPTHQYAPFPSIFLIHEMRVRGHNPFVNINPDMPDVISWQDWIITRGFVAEDGSLNHDGPSCYISPNMKNPSPQFPQNLQGNSDITGASSSGRSVQLNADIVNEILAKCHRGRHV